MSALNYKTVPGTQVPRRARRLTRGRNGVMQDWYDKNRDRMIATLLFRKGKLIGWCAVIRVKWWIFYTKEFKISTYVQKNMRGRGYAKSLLNQTLKTINLVEPKGKVLYGTPSDHGYFNKTYIRQITAKGLKPVRHYATLED